MIAVRELDCASCGRRVERRSRQQRFCSDRCKEKARERVRTPVRGRGSAPSNLNAVALVSAHAPPKSTNEINGGQAAKIRGIWDVIRAEVFGRHQWESRISSGGIPIMVARRGSGPLQRRS